MDKLDETMVQIQINYLENTGKELGFHVVKIGEGTHLLTESVEKKPQVNELETG